MVDFEEIRQRIDNSPFAFQLGMKVVELSRGYAKVKLELKEEFRNWEELIHGGVIFTLLDQAAGSSGSTYDDIYVASQINIHFVEAASVGETLYAESRVLKAGRRTGLMKVQVVDSKGKTIAFGTGTATNLGPRS